MWLLDNGLYLIKTYLTLFLVPNFKQFLDEVFCDFWNNQGLGKGYQQRLKAEADNANSISSITQMKWKKTTTLKMIELKLQQ